MCRLAHLGKFQAKVSRLIANGFEGKSSWKDGQLLKRTNTHNQRTQDIPRTQRRNNASLTTINIDDWTFVHVPPSDNVIHNRYDSHSTKHNATVIHRLDSDDSEQWEEADDSLLNHVQDSKNVDGNAQFAEGEPSRWQGSLGDLSPEYACDTD